MIVHPPDTNLDHAAAVYVLRCAVTGRVKIGSSYRPTQRALAHRSASPTHLEVLGYIEPPEPNATWDRDYGRPARSLERHLHLAFRDARAKGEWFAPRVTFADVEQAARTWEAAHAPA